MSQIDAIQVVTTTGTRDEAEMIARGLVGRRLAACVQVSGPLSSTYHWQGVLERGLEEWMCLIKTSRTHYEAVEAAIREVHPYDLPEIIALPVVAGSRDYLDWLQGELCELPDTTKQV